MTHALVTIKKLSLRSGFLSIALTCCLTSACTIGPRTSIESSGPAPKEESKKDVDDGFVLPKAERVTDDDEPDEMPDETKVEGESTEVKVEEPADSEEDAPTEDAASSNDDSETH